MLRLLIHAGCCQHGTRAGPEPCLCRASPEGGKPAVIDSLSVSGRPARARCLPGIRRQVVGDPHHQHWDLPSWSERALVSDSAGAGASRFNWTAFPADCLAVYPMRAALTVKAGAAMRMTRWLARSSATMWPERTKHQHYPDRDRMRSCPHVQRRGVQPDGFYIRAE